MLPVWARVCFLCLPVTLSALFFPLPCITTHLTCYEPQHLQQTPSHLWESIILNLNYTTAAKQSTSTTQIVPSNVYYSSKLNSSTLLTLTSMMRCACYTCAFKPGCLMSHNWLHTPDCKIRVNKTTPFGVNLMRSRQLNEKPSIPGCPGNPRL